MITIKIKTALHWDTIRLVPQKALAKQGPRDFSDKHWRRLVHQGSSKTRFECCEDSKNSLAYFRAIQVHSGGITIDPELMGHLLIPYKLKEYIFHRGCSFSIQSILEKDSFQVERKGREAFFTPLNPFGEDSDEEEPRDDYTVLQKVHNHTNNCKRNQDAVYWVKLSPSSRSRIAILANEVTCNHRTQSCASRLHLQRSNNVRKTLNPMTRAESHTEKQLALAAAVAVSL